MKINKKRLIYIDKITNMFSISERNLIYLLVITNDIFNYFKCGFKERVALIISLYEKTQDYYFVYEYYKKLQEEKIILNKISLIKSLKKLNNIYINGENLKYFYETKLNLILSDIETINFIIK